MDPERDAEDSHAGPGQNPKLSLAGRLDCYVDGRPLSLVADKREVTLSIGKFNTLLTLRRGWKTVMQPVRVLFELAEMRLLLRIPWFGKVEVFPNPNYIVNIMLPRV